jgi:hypothetical protein
MYRSISTIGSAVLWVLLPKCSLCLMAYAGLFSAIGLGGLVRNKLALPLVIVLMAINLAAVVYMSVIKKEYGYALLSLGCALLLTVNKLYIGSVAINVIAALVLLMAVLRVRLFRLKTKQCVFKNGDACKSSIAT